MRSFCLCKPSIGFRGHMAPLSLPRKRTFPDSGDRCWRKLGLNAGQCDGRPSISRCRDHSVGNLSPDLVKARPSMAASRRAWASLASPTCRQSFPPSPRLLFGRWRIVEMDVWDKDFLDLVETAHLTFKGAADGEIAFGALKGLPRCSLRHPRRFGVRGVLVAGK